MWQEMYVYILYMGDLSLPLDIIKTYCRWGTVGSMWIVLDFP